MDPAVLAGPAPLRGRGAPVPPAVATRMTLARRWREAQADQVRRAGAAGGRDRRRDARATCRSSSRPRAPRSRSSRRQIRLAMLERDPADDKNVIVEIRAGTGGEEAALFAADLYRMLTQYAARLRFKVETLSTSPSETPAASRRSRSRSRATARTPSSSGSRACTACSACRRRRRRGASTPRRRRWRCCPRPRRSRCTSTRRTSRSTSTAPRGPGGQSVNTTDSAVRITHVPVRHRGRLPGRALAAAEQGARHAHPARPDLRARARGAGAGAGRRAALADRLGQPLREDPHVQLPAEPHHRPPRQAHEPLAGAGAADRRARRASPSALQADWNRRRLEEATV